MKIADENSEFLLDRNTAFPNLQNIWERDWIQRVWAFQEVLLAANPVLCCGTKVSLLACIHIQRDFSRALKIHVQYPRYILNALLHLGWTTFFVDSN